MQERQPARGVEVRELGPEQTGLAHAAMLELGREVGDAATFAARVNRDMRPEGYRLVAALEPGEPQAVAAAGFRVINDLVHGRQLFVDDLATLPAFRRRGHAGALMEWMKAEARRQGCRFVSLESGVLRHDAHRFYLNQGMKITSHHFRLDLAD
ncbi:MAG TPA: GNAT family N-acetyltransferase [Candidatus Dormibacteraeota bacterium]|jgi:GNAT superfamily N-acetyltransferase|nr:GNAT family N-acetyltransferase [Candidatus Dormibacteraeota bacterium]